MARTISTAILGAAICLSGCATRRERKVSAQKQEVPAQKENVSAYRRTVLLGTRAWDAESDKQDSRDTADFWWEHATDIERYLVPRNGSRAKLVSHADFDRIGPSFIDRQDLSRAKISGSDHGGLLRPGSVVVFRTAEGNWGKLQVERYRALHDFSFPEAAYLSEKTKRFFLTKPNREVYHLQVRWQLFRYRHRHRGHRLVVSASFENYPDGSPSLNGISIDDARSVDKNPSYKKSMRFLVDGAYLVASFFVNSPPQSAKLNVVHLSSEHAQARNGGWSPITISINGKTVVANHSPRSHNYMTESWNVGPLLRKGSNSIKFYFDNSQSHYWLQSFEIVGE